MTIRIIWAAAMLTALSLAGTAHAAQFYKWTDAQGVTHYSAEPPPKSASNASSVKVKTRLPADSAAASENLQKQRDGAKAATEKTADKAKTPSPESASADKGSAPERYAERCKGLQGDLTTMEEHARISVTDEKGEVRSLTEEEKQQRMDDTRRQIKAFCE